MHKQVAVRIWLQMLLERNGLSQKEVAQMTTITHQFYNYIENGERNPSVKIAKQIASALNFDWTLFFPEDIITSDKQKLIFRKSANAS